MEHRQTDRATSRLMTMERAAGPSDLWTWSARVATWGAVAFAALVAVAAVVDWSLPGGVAAERWVPVMTISVVFAGAVAGLQRRWTCVSAALAVFALGSMIAGTDTGVSDASEWSTLIEPAALSVELPTVDMLPGR
ncbi:MAG: hypothetical protein GX868_02590 [Actinobacteria bacterium]|nr:hypothetical protein [Actinomycetota bacterium]